MDSIFAFFLVLSLIGGLLAGLLGEGHKVKPSRNIFSFFFFDRY